MYYIDDNLKLIIGYSNRIESIYDYENVLIGNIYRGRVEDVLDSMNAAFVNIGEEKNAYLSLKDTRYTLHEGDEILVQIKKVPSENKAVKITTELSLGGKYLVYFPEDDFIKFSNKLEKEDIKRFKKIGEKGVLYRTKSRGASLEDLQSEINYFKKVSKSILLQKDKRPTPKLIYNKNGAADYIFKNIDKSDEILTNNKELYKDLKDNFNITCDESFGLKYSSDLFLDYKTLFNERVELLNGGNIVIEETESLTAIDVNTASFLGDNSFEDTVFENNIVAAKEIARQIRLRNISGIILVDFVDMKKKSHRNELLKVLKEEFLKDESKSEVYGYTRLNLVEISRKNNGEELRLKLD